MSESKQEIARLIRNVEGQLRRGILGQDEFIRGLLIGALADGHVLIEGVPGLGKTRAVNLLARACRMDFKRLQFTPDLLPSDILGTRIYNHELAGFETVKGPVFSNLILVDEINRAPAKVQSALLETMEERQVTIGKDTLPLPSPFLVFATQNPIEQEGTYPLPEAQLDRFLLKVVLGYPKAEEEPEIVKMVIDEGEGTVIEPVLDGRQLLALQRAARDVFIEERLILYATDLVRATRKGGDLELDLSRHIEVGASPRGSIALAQAARASALIDGRDSVTPDDIKGVAHRVLRHRIIRTYYAEAERISCDNMVDEILAAVSVP